MWPRLCSEESMVKKQFVFLFILSFFLIVSFQNCKVQPIQSNSSQSDQSSFSLDISELDQALKKLSLNLDPSCWENSKYNACIFWKNPVAQSGRALASEITGSSSLKHLQIHGINIEGYDSSGYLGNSTMRIFSADSSNRLTSLSTASGQFKYEFGNDPNHRFSQVMAFHWLNTQKEWMEKWTGHFFAADRGINVVSYIPNVENAYWDHEKNAILIGSTSSGNELSLSAEVYAHEMGHANVSFATNGKIFEQLGSAESQSCGETVCCKTKNGCSWAIDEGVADYHFAMLFPDSTSMLESFINDANGLSECGISRSVDANASLTSQAAYDACSSNYKGEVHLMGRVYASAWWEVRKKAEAANPGQGARDIDTLFTNHLPALSGQDDFFSALAKILATEQALFRGRYASLFRAEFSQRGVF